MKDETIKEALAYSLGSDLHERWREDFRKLNGDIPRIKKSKDPVWNEKHQTDEVDIASTPFAELPSNWQHENLEAAKVVINLVYDKIMNDELITPEETEKMAAIVHEEWLKRNPYIFGPKEEGGRPDLAVPYANLSPSEKDKDKAQLALAISKVQDYKKGLINIESLCEEYNLSTNTKTI